MPQHDPTWPAPYASMGSDGAITLVELRGASGKLYGMLDVASGVIMFKLGPGRGESIDLTPYFKAATVKDRDSR
jgi:hypothetical protein